jgi:hypothetical protein
MSRNSSSIIGVSSFSHRGTRLSLAAFVALTAFGKITVAFAVDGFDDAATVVVRAESKPSIVKASGIVFSSRSSFNVEETTVTKIGDKLYEISFSVPRSKIQPDSVASAIATDENGAAVFGNVTPALSSETRDLLASVPECPGEDSSKVTTISTPGALKQLVDVRAERLDIVRLKLKRSMDENVLAKLTKFEEAFGLKRSSDLSPDLPAAELIDRLSGIEHALKKYQSYKTSGSR